MRYGGNLKHRLTNIWTSIMIFSSCVMNKFRRGKRSLNIFHKKKMWAAYPFFDYRILMAVERHVRNILLLELIHVINILHTLHTNVCQSFTTTLQGISVFLIYSGMFMYNVLSIQVYMMYYRSLDRISRWNRVIFSRKKILYTF